MIFFLMMYQIFNTHILQIDTMSNTEVSGDYGFIFPVYADIANPLEFPESYSPSYSDNNRYFISLFGPRFKYTNYSNVNYFDFHQGEDFTANVSYNGAPFNETNKYPIVSMSDGYISHIHDGNDAEMEITESGRFVEIRSDSTFHKKNNTWINQNDSIYLRYYHLSSINNGLSIGQRIFKGDTIGIVGSSGTTNFTHLHLNVYRKTNTKYINVHPMRIFNPNHVIHLHKKLSQAKIEVLKQWEGTDSLLIRIIIPYNQVVLKSIEFINTSNDPIYKRTYDLESISANYSSYLRDQNNLVDGLKLYAYGFNRGQTARNRYLSDSVNIPASYPASRKRAETFEIVENSVSYILDVTVHGLPFAYELDKSEMRLFDIYGNCIRAYFAKDFPASVLLSKNAIQSRFFDNYLELKIQISNYPDDAELKIQKRIFNNKIETGWFTIKKLISASEQIIIENFDACDSIQYRVIAVQEGIFEKTNIENNSITVYPKFYLNTLLKFAEVHPNPFNMECQINFKIQTSEKLAITIYDLLGRVVKHVINAQWFDYGTYSIKWNGKNILNHDVASGIYILVIQNEKQILFKNKMVLIK